MLHPLRALNTTISHCNPTFLNCETAKCYQLSLSLASGKTHMDEKAKEGEKKLAAERCYTTQHKETEA